MNRREFATWVGLGALATSLPMVLAACGSEESSTDTADLNENPSETSPEGEVVGTLSELDASGSLLNEAAVAGPVLLIKDPADESQVIAVNPVCPHASCNVEWQADQTLFVCPCHNSQFNVDGTVAQGPAAQPLETYQTIVFEENIVIQ